LTLEAKYTDGTPFEVSAQTSRSSFQITPLMVQGAVVTDGTDYYWAPVTDYTVTAVVGDKPWAMTYRHGGAITVIPVQRGQESSGAVGGKYTTIPIYAFQTNGNKNGDLEYGSNFSGVGDASVYNYVIGYYLPTINGYVMGTALDLTGPDTAEVYIDQVNFDKSQYKLMATYVDLTKKEIPLDNAVFEIRPYYNLADQRDRSTAGPGDLLVTVGKNNYLTNDQAKKSFLANATFDTNFNSLVGSNSLGDEAGYLTARHYFEKVYHVKSISLTTPIDESSGDNFPFMYYWEPDSSAEWKKRLEDWEVTIEYVNGVKRDPIKIKDLGTTADGSAWWNGDDGNPYDGRPDAENTVTQFNALDYRTIGILGAHKSSATAKQIAANDDGLAFNKIGDRAVVRLNYRGAVTTIPVDIGIKVEGIDVEYKDGTTGPKDVNVRALDTDVKGNDALWFSQQVKVTARVNTARGFQKHPELRYVTAGTTDPKAATANQEPYGNSNLQTAQQGPTALAGGEDGVATTTGNVPNRNYLVYTMDFGNAGMWQDKFATGWGQSNIAKNDGNDKVVTFYFNTPTVGKTAINNTTATKKLKTNIEVHWIDVRAR